METATMCHFVLVLHKMVAKQMQPSLLQTLIHATYMRVYPHTT